MYPQWWHEGVFCFVPSAVAGLISCTCVHKVTWFLTLCTRRVRVGTLSKGWLANVCCIFYADVFCFFFSCPLQESDLAIAKQSPEFAAAGTGKFAQGWRSAVHACICHLEGLVFCLSACVKSPYSSGPPEDTARRYCKSEWSTVLGIIRLCMCGLKSLNCILWRNVQGVPNFKFDSFCFDKSIDCSINSKQNPMKPAGANESHNGEHKKS